MEERKPKFNDLQDDLRSMYIKKYIIIGALMIVLSIVLIYMKLYSYIPFIVMIAAAISLIYLLQIYKCLQGKCNIYQGIIIEKVESIKGGKIKQIKRVVTKKQLRSSITIKLNDDNLLKINLHQKNIFEEGTSVKVYAPQEYIIKRATDYYELSSYYYLKQDRIRPEVENSDNDNNESDKNN